MENFLTKVKDVSKKKEAGPVLIRSREGYHEEQLAIYKCRERQEMPKLQQNKQRNNSIAESKSSKIIKNGKSQRIKFLTARTHEAKEQISSSTVSMFDNDDQNQHEPYEFDIRKALITQETKQQTKDTYFNHIHGNKPLVSQLTTTEVSERYPEIFEKWQL